MTAGATAPARQDRTTAAATAVQQVRALLALRWQMTRRPGARLLLCLAGALVVWLTSLCLRAGEVLDPVALEAAAALAPEAYLGLGVLALVAPLTAGGGTEVVPGEQLVAHPVRPQAQFLAGVLMAPLDLLWVVQLLVLAVEVSCLTVGGSRAAGLATTGAYVLLVTVLGQALGWLVVGLRQSRTGRRAVLVAAAAVLLGTAQQVREGGVAALEQTPPGLLAGEVVRAVVAGGAGDVGPWLLVTAGLLAGVVLGLAAGARACAWAAQRPGGGGADARPVRRRPLRPSPLRQLVALDRAGVWRTPALRRGTLVLALLPGLLAAGAQVPWTSLVVLPALVAAGTGLLFGVNAFALDGAGAVWLASLPAPPALVLRAKLLVVGETVLAAALLAVVPGALRAPVPPTAAELAAVLATAATCTVVVAATGLHLSLRSPHRADLRTPRDTIAPPGALAAASVRLAAPTALTGVLLGTAAGTGWAALPVLLAVPVLALAGLSLRRTLRRWEDPYVRARVVDAVSRG